MYFGMFFRSETSDLQYIHIPHTDILVLNKLKLKYNDENILKPPPHVTYSFHVLDGS